MKKPRTQQYSEKYKTKHNKNMNLAIAEEPKTWHNTDTYLGIARTNTPGHNKNKYVFSKSKQSNYVIRHINSELDWHNKTCTKIGRTTQNMTKQKYEFDNRQIKNTTSQNHELVDSQSKQKHELKHETWQ